MKLIYTSLQILTGLLFLTGIFAGCTEGNDWEVDPSKAALFRVRNVEVPEDKVAAQTASVSWTATSATEYYIIEVSTEELSDNKEMGTAKNSIVYGEDKSITSVPAMLTGLTKESTYYLRVKSFGNGLESGWAYLDGSFTTTAEDILQKTFAKEDITAESIRVKWNDAGLPVTHLKYEWEITNGEEVTTEEATYDLSADEISAQTAVITGLQPDKKYIIYIYNDEDLRGMTEATTEQILTTPEILGGNVTLNWNAKGAAVTKITYSSSDNTDSPEEHQLTEDEISASKATLSDLTLGKEYTFRIYNGTSLRGVAIGSTEQIMNISDADVRGKSVTVTWADNEIAVTKLTYQAENGTETEWEGDLSAEGTNVTGLEGLTTYTFRVYTGNVLRGEQTVTTLEEKIDVTIKAGITSATFTWTDAPAAVSYSCTTAGETENKVNLTPEEITAGEVTVSGLTGNTNYTFTLYNGAGEAISNEQTFKTEVDPLEGYKKVYLTTISDWNDIWTNPENTGKIAIILTEGVNYDMSSNSNYTSIIPENVTSLAIWGGEDGEEYNEATKPIIGFRNFSFAASSINEIKFFNVAIKSNKEAGSAAGSGNILFRQATPTTIKNMSFQSCKIYNARGFIVHDRNAVGTTQSLTIDKCYFDNIGDYAIIGNRNGHTINSILFTNSTVNNCAGNIFRVNQSSKFILDIDYCTFYNCGNGSTQWIRSDSDTDDIKVTNSLFAALCIRTQSDGICNTLKKTCEKVFRTNDCTGTNYADYWSTAISGSATDLFTDPVNGNFTVKLPEYAAYGDPRWNNQ